MGDIVKMVTKIFCDYCGEEFSEYHVRKGITKLEIGVEEKDVCEDCSSKIIDFIETIEK